MISTKEIKRVDQLKETEQKEKNVKRKGVCVYEYITKRGSA